MHHPGRPATTVWWWVSTPLIVAGACCAFLQIGESAALAVTVLGGAATAFVVRALRGRPRAPRPATEVAAAGLLGGVLALGIVGWVAALGAAGFGLCLLVAATGGLALSATRPPGTATGRRSRRDGPTGVPALESVAETPLPAPSALPASSTADVCWAWRVSYLRVARAGCPGYEVAALTELRRACLEELERRDPVAFARWLPTARAAGDPTRAFCRQSQRR
jgi:hypothetical protein